MLEGAEHVRGGATGSNPHQGVSGPETPLLQIAAAGLSEVFQPLGTAQQRRGSARQHPLHQLRWRTERGGTFGGIEHPEAAGGAGSEIEEATTAAQAGSDRINSGGQGLPGIFDGLLRLPIVAAEERHQRGCIELVKLLAGRIGLFGEQVAAAAHGTVGR